MQRKLALVTGASAGIGQAFARLLAAKGFDLALSARRVERLQALAAEIGERHGVQAVLDQVAASGRSVDVLITNAGYGLVGSYASTSWAEQQAFLQVMVTAPCELAHKLLPAMAQRRWGRIVNVASLAGLVPGAAGHTLYGASKSLLIKFSQSLHLEAAPLGVHVTALCPGFTWSEFHDVNGTRARLAAGTPRWLWMAAEPVVEAGWRGVEANRPLIVPGLANKALGGLARLLPEALAMKVIASQGERFREA